MLAFIIIIEEYSIKLPVIKPFIQNFMKNRFLVENYEFVTMGIIVVFLANNVNRVFYF